MEAEKTRGRSLVFIQEIKQDSHRAVNWELLGIHLPHRGIVENIPCMTRW
jgi:hypothetical protein